MDSPDYEAIARAGLEALRKGDPAAARAAFEEVEAAGRASIRLRVLHAEACELAGDDAALELVLAPVLKAEPRNLSGLLMMGESRLRQGDDRAAASWFGLAMSSAQRQPGHGADIGARLERASRSLADLSRNFEAYLLEQLDAAQSNAGQVGGRFREALDIMAGRAQPQLQQPTSFYYPRLPQIPFYDRADFEWVEALEARTEAIRAEAEKVLEAGQDVSPYVQPNIDRPTREHALLDDPNWSAYYLWKDGMLVEGRAQACPNAVAALQSVPMPVIAKRAPTVLFSVLHARTHIPPHWGMMNTRLICHLPLIVPWDCRLRVGNETRAVEKGKMLIFDDSIEHEAWNDSDETRVVLLFEIWRPELDITERRALTAMLEAIGVY